jgi:DMSO/TMAO reductase YedYZ molybdopterin-dependent catalytic subunit
MSGTVSRRKWLRAGAATAAGAAGLTVAVKIADRYGLIPPDCGGIWGPGVAMTYATQRVLMSGHSMAREFNRSEISKVTPVTGWQPKTDEYQRLKKNGFKDWRLTIDGLVARPSSFSLEEIKRMPARSQITHQACEEGWSFIAEWTGVPLSYMLNLVGISPKANYVAYFAYDNRWDSVDMPDALHPQTLLAYGMNGEDLLTDHGAPIRMRVPRQLGQKSKKYLRKMTVVDSLKNVGDGRGAIDPSEGYTWYMGI